MKKEKGITLIALVITIIVLLILASIATYSGISTIKSSKLNKFKQELEIMQAQVQILYEKYKDKDTIDIGKDINSSGREEEANTAFNGAEETEKAGYRLFDKEEIQKLGIDGIERDYLLDIMRRKVICLQGFEYNETIYYTLEQLTDKNVIKDGIERGDVTFEYTTEELSDGGWKVTVYNIKFSKYVGKGMIQYISFIEGKIKFTTVETNAKEGECYEFTISNEGSYYILVSDAAEVSKMEMIILEGREGLKVGDYVNYIPDENKTGYTINIADSTTKITQDQQYAKDGTGMTWQILRIYDDGSIDLIGSPTSQNVILFGEDGYNNGVTVLNEICETLYSRGNIKARSVNYEDLEYWLTDEGKKVRDAYYSYNGGVRYGNIRTYIKYVKPSGGGDDGTLDDEEIINATYYPNLYAQEIGSGIDTETVKTTGLGLSDEGTAIGYSKGSTCLTVKQTFWSGNINSTNFGEGYNVLPLGNTYWIASRYVNCYTGFASFGFFYVSGANIYGTDMFNSIKSYMETVKCFLRPVITLSSTVQIENCIGENSIDNMHKIIQY